MLKRLKNIRFGILYGIIFGIIGIPISLFLSVIVSVSLESLAELLSYNIWSFSFYISLVGLILPSLYYLYTVFFKPSKKDLALITLFFFFMAFINVCAFYKIYANVSDGQLAFGLLVLPFKTFYIYPLLGFIHYIISKYYESKNITIN